MKKFLHKRTKKSEYFRNLNTKDLNDDKKFWEKINFLFR